MLGGFPVRDLDFTVETNAMKVAKSPRNRAPACCRPTKTGERRN